MEESPMHSGGPDPGAAYEGKEVSKEGQKGITRFANASQFCHADLLLSHYLLLSHITLSLRTGEGSEASGCTSRCTASARVPIRRRHNSATQKSGRGCSGPSRGPSSGRASSAYRPPTSACQQVYRAARRCVAVRCCTGGMLARAVRKPGACHARAVRAPCACHARAMRVSGACLSAGDCVAHLRMRTQRIRVP